MRHPMQHIIIIVIAGFMAHIKAMTQADQCRTTTVQLVKDKGYNLTGQTHVITGGDTGIGLGIAEGLVRANAKVVFLAHNVEKTQALVRSLSASTKNDKLSVIPLNLLSLASAKKAADTLLTQEDRIDVFIGDAGVYMESSITDDGFESVFEATYLSHFYLVQRLLPKLRESRGRVVFTGNAGMNPFTETDFLCPPEVPEDCQTIDHIKYLAKHTSSNPDFLALYLKVLLGTTIAIFEPLVTAYSFYPGLVFTPGATPYFTFKSIYTVGGYGSILGCILGHVFKRGNKSRPCCWWLLGVFFGCLVGYLKAGSFTVATNCGGGWQNCLCQGPNGTQSQNCPLSDLEGGVSGVYLAAAPRSELQSINGSQIVLCGLSWSQEDPYTALVAHDGEVATLKYLKDLYDISLQWISMSGQSQQTSLSETATKATDVPLACIVGCAALLSLFLASVAYRKRASTQGRHATSEGAGVPFLDSERS